MQEANSSINPLQVLARALASTGSINNLSRLSGINRNTLSNIFKKKYKTNFTTILRLVDFADQNSKYPNEVVSQSKIKRHSK